MGLRLEKIWPFLAAALSGAAAHWIGICLPADEKEFLAAALSLGAVLTGFVATAQAILMALPQDSVMTRIRNADYLDVLTSYIAHALNGTMLFSVITLFGFFLRSESVRLPAYYSTIWVAAGVFAGCAFYRVTKLMLTIMRLP